MHVDLTVQSIPQEATFVSSPLLSVVVSNRSTNLTVPLQGEA